MTLVVRVVLGNAVTPTDFSFRHTGALFTADLAQVSVVAQAFVALGAVANATLTIGRTGVTAARRGKELDFGCKTAPFDEDELPRTLR